MPHQDTAPDTPKRPETKPSASKASAWLVKLALWALGLLAAGLFCLLMVVGVAMVTAYPNLPDISDLADYKPKLPLRVFTADGQLMGEFGEERRNLTPIKEIPQIMKDAVLSIEDNRFYDHGGVDYLGILRAGIANIGRLKSQGASTITMQVARNVYLSSEKTYTRKIYEILLTYKLEHLLTKDQILEIYMNQIFLGNRAYGFASAAETYFGKSLKNITIAQSALGLQPHRQPQTCPFTPALHHRAHGRKRLHHRATGCASQSRAFGFEVIWQQKNSARRVCC
jgi:penicillin-binding protein 1A